MQSMKRTYGGKKGEQVFYATRNAGKITGVEEKAQGGTGKTGTLGLKKVGKAKSKSRVNEAGNYTKPGMRKRICSIASRPVARADAPDSGRRVKLRNVSFKPTKKQGAVTKTNEACLSPVCLSWHRRGQTSSQ